MTSTHSRVVAAIRNDQVLTDGSTIVSVRLVRHDRDLLLLPTASPTGTTLTLEVSAGQVVAATAAIDGGEIAVPFVRRVGPGLSFIALTGGEINTARFDRQERVFGRAGQLVLSALHVGVVGAGGTGSAVIEQLARLGVGRITVVDDDHLTDTNLTRIHQSTSTDVGMSKCEVAGRLARELGVSYRPVSGRVTQPDVAKELTSCDIVFGCTDDHAGRIVLARMAPRYVQLLIDVGVTIDVADGQVLGAPCRLSIQEPGDPCVVCRGYVDMATASAELMSPDDRQSLAREGYVPGLGEPDPAVVAYTTLAASAAVAEMLSRLFQFAGRCSQDWLIDPVVGRWASLSRPAAVIDGCTLVETIGSGDAEPFLEMGW